MRYLVSRMFAGIFLGALFATYVTADYARWTARGKDAFLAAEALRFDRYMVRPRPFIMWFVVSAIMALFVSAIYETSAYAVSAVLKRLSSDE